MVDVFILIASHAAVAFAAVAITSVIMRNKKEIDYDKIVDSFSNVRKELNTLEHRVNLRIKGEK